MNGRRIVFAVALALTIVTVARSGHELPVYPSYYPHEIELSAVPPERAAELLPAGKIQAYVGNAPRFAGARPETIGNIESLGSFVILRLNPASRLTGDERSACAATETVARDLAGRSGDLVFHPYPVTPFHGDYLHHVDLAESAKARILAGSSTSGTQDLKVKAESTATRALVRAEWLAQGPDWDVEIAEIGVAELIAAASHSTNGWLGPAWIRTGWFHASLVLGGQARDTASSRGIDDLRRLQAIDYGDAAERINLERSLVTGLASDCRLRVAGYTVKREYFSTIFTAGIENISFDALDGFNAPIFIRTVKLKDFPWNGWLALGIDAQPSAAWNPIAGFTDPFGRLMWSAIGDPALIPSPYEASWILNRISDVQSSRKP
jgi:hypothetical protein